MSTNRWSPYVQSACHYCKIIPFNVIQDLSASCHDLNHRQRLFCDNDWLSSFLFPLKSCFISFHFNFSAKIITFHTSPLITNLYLRFWSFHRATRTLLTLIYWCFFCLLSLSHGTPWSGLQWVLYQRLCCDSYTWILFDLSCCWLPRWLFLIISCRSGQWERHCRTAPSAPHQECAN